MPQHHVIRLRGPWLCWPSSSAEMTENAAITVHCRDDNGLSQLPVLAARSRVLFRRSFHRPTGLGSSTVVRLIVHSAAPSMTLSLNARRLGTIGGGRHEFNISDDLQPANRLDIEMPAECVQSYRALPDLVCCHLELSARHPKG